MMLTDALPLCLGVNTWYSFGPTSTRTSRALAFKSGCREVHDLHFSTQLLHMVLKDRVRPEPCYALGACVSVLGVQRPEGVGKMVVWPVEGNACARDKHTMEGQSSDIRQSPHHDNATGAPPVGEGKETLAHALFEGSARSKKGRGHQREQVLPRCLVR